MFIVVGEEVAFQDSLRDNLQPTPNTAPPNNSIRDYWNNLTFVYRCLFVVASVLLSCAATEAFSERVFSHEAIVHSRLRNSLDIEVVRAILFIRLNYKYIANNILRRHSDL